MSRKRREKRIQRLRKQGFEVSKALLQPGSEYVLTKQLGFFPIRKDVDVIPHEVQVGHGPLPSLKPPTVMTVHCMPRGRTTIDGKEASPEEIRAWWKACGYTDEDFEGPPP